MNNYSSRLRCTANTGRARTRPWACATPSPTGSKHPPPWAVATAARSARWAWPGSSRRGLGRRRHGTIGCLCLHPVPPPPTPPPPPPAGGAWVRAGGRPLPPRARPAQLQALAPLSDAEAARVMALLRNDTPHKSVQPDRPASESAHNPGIATGHFRPRITLMTLGRGDGLLGMAPQGKLGPRGDSVTLVQIDWTYRTDDGAHWQTPAPTSILNARPGPVQDLFDTGGPVVRMQRNLGAEADAMDRVWDLGLIPVDANKLQWRHRAAAATLGPVWTLAQEAHFGDFWAEQIPQLRAEGWSVVVQPGFAHESVPVLRWKLLIAPDTGELLGKEVDGPLAARERAVQKLQLPEREGAWMLSLGLEIDGETLDLAPMLADLLRRDARWLNAQQMAAIDDIAMGKTAQALAHVRAEKEAGRLPRPALVVLPTSLLFNWQAEAARMAPSLRVLALHGASRGQRYLQMADHDLVLTTYPLLWRDVDALAAQPFHLLILDEAQMVKNAGSRSARALRKLQAPHLLCLTGTPLENHLGELWAQFDFPMPGFLGDVRSFNARWRKPIEENGETLRAQLLAQRVRPFILRRRKQDVATELPPRTEVIQRVQLQGKQRELYEAVRTTADKQVRRALERQSFDGAQITILDALLKLRQVCCDPRLVKGTTKTAHTMERAKLELLADMLPALVDEGRRVLVFSQFTEMLGLAAELLDTLALPYLTLTGQTPPRQRGAVVRQFQTQDDTSAPILLVSLKAGGLGLNLTAADTVIHLDPWWNPAVEEQATARAHRIGQDQPVFVYKLVVGGSIEERMLGLRARKAARARGVLGHDAEGAVKFSEADLHALLAPLSEPVNNPLGIPGEDALRWGGTGKRRPRPLQPPEV